MLLDPERSPRMRVLAGFVPPAVLLCALSTVATAAATVRDKAIQRMTLEQAVAKVQTDTGGKVLAADTQRRGRTIEYRIKVLTPNGHVRVVPVRTEALTAKNDKEKR